MNSVRHGVKRYSSLFVVLLTLAVSRSAYADPLRYEPGIDPGVGFNLVSWWNFGSGGANVWRNAVQAAHDAGFDEVSLSPVRYFTIGTGSIAPTSGSGPELSHIAAGIVRAKQLGMRVTVNPFVEPVNFTMWRGQYDPVPNSAEWTTFWSNYQQYIVDVATTAQTNGADAVTVGTELKALELNSGNNPKWTSLIDAVDGVFSGQIGYASNWDSYANGNPRDFIWDHPAVDFIGIDSYFTGLVTNTAADASGTYPNPNFISTMETAWNSKLEDEILPFAAARHDGAGLPVEFTEVGYLPRNRTARNPQGASQPLDDDEQTMAFEGLMRALDHRQAAGEFLATHIWQWDMQGSSGSDWNMNPSGGDEPTNQQTAQWLSSFMNGTNPNPGIITNTADFNEDGDVDGRDFLTWQRGFGTTGTGDLAGGDANGDGNVDAADLAIWQEQYGIVLEVNVLSVVPEPNAFVIAIFSLMAAGIGRPKLSFRRRL